MSDDELIPYDLTPEHPVHYVRVPPGWEFRNAIPRSAPDPIAMAVMSDVADGDEDPSRTTAETACRVYWGSHGCRHERGHSPLIPHECDCCECGDKHPDNSWGHICVAKPPYYGSDTRFYGEDAEAIGLTLESAPRPPGRLMGGHGSWEERYG